VVVHALVIGSWNCSFIYPGGISKLLFLYMFFVYKKMKKRENKKKRKEKKTRKRNKRSLGLSIV